MFCCVSIAKPLALVHRKKKAKVRLSRKYKEDYVKVMVPEDLKVELRMSMNEQITSSFRKQAVSLR